MRFLDFLKKSKYLVASSLIGVLFFGLPGNIIAEQMGSSTYKIQSDSINLGGNNSASGTYNLGDTLGEVGTGDSNSTNYYMHAGYWQMGESYISISSPSDLVMSSMSGLSGGSSEGTMSWNVLTDNTAGYAMSISATTNPALKSAQDSIADYTPAGSNPDYNFTNASTASSFGFSPEGSYVDQKYKDNGSSCNTGSLETAGKCWDGLSTTPKVIAGSSSSTHPLGSDVTVRFRAESGADHIQTSGKYDVTIVVTATTL